MTPDPLVSRPDRLSGYGPYAYAANNPATLTDPTGLQVDDDREGAGQPPFGGFVVDFSSTPTLGPTPELKKLGTYAEVRAQVKAVGPCSGQAPPAGMQCAFNVILKDDHSFDIYQAVGANSRGSNAPLGRFSKLIAAHLPWLHMNDDTKASIDGGLLLASVVPVGAIAEAFGRPSSKILAKLLKAAGIEKNEFEASHHIVAGRAEAAKPAREVLEEFEVGINQAENGVNLPANTQVPNPTGASPHSIVHTNEIYDIVNQYTVPVGNRRTLLRNLQWLREALLGGDLP